MPGFLLGLFPIVNLNVKYKIIGLNNEFLSYYYGIFILL
ncbi:MAG: hypothetical protein JWP78_3061 [Mucilaginibacter sp.]|nr:hypothetical protein [Mucilaginibacter sp.]